jgi:hypothetical protein
MYISAISEGPFHITAELTEMVGILERKPVQVFTTSCFILFTLKSSATLSTYLLNRDLGGTCTKQGGE